MAEHLLRHRAKEKKLDLDVASAGLAAFPGDPGAENALKVLAERGIDGSGHRSRKVQPRLLEEFDLILAMTSGHKKQLLGLAPQLAGRIFLLKEFAKGAEQGQEADDSVEKEYEISDPFGQSLDVYRQSLEEIDRAVQAILQFLEGGSTMNVAIGSDHGGFRAKQALVEHLRGQGFSVEDLGTDSADSCDYPDIAKEVAQAVVEGRSNLGILICGTGIGMSIAANKVPGIRAALCHDTFSARMARSHNDSNILCMGERVLGLGLMFDVVHTYLHESFSGGRHQRRVDKIEQA
ncbi:MAG TPA: ribose 5-phosphate isomerase B [Firmicutes bacterium]|jgi:ribose 5-phosphate isomerase B|nr:ribose 5-phosphate isomerase B [Bacillota bacterium]